MITTLMIDRKKNHGTNIQERRIYNNDIKTRTENN